MNLVLMCCLWFCGVNSLRFAAREGFQDKLMSVKQRLNNNFYQNSRDKNELKMDTSLLWSKPMEMQPHFNNMPTIVKTSNHTLLLNNMDLYSLKNEQLYQVTSLSSTYDIQLAQGFEWRGRLFLLICFKNNVCKLYVSTSGTDIVYRQSLSQHDRMPIDAQFFEQQGSVFLAVLFQAFNSTTSQIRVYRWHNLYMDQEPIPEMISTASSITLFEYKGDIVFILGCSGDYKLKFPSQVWCRKQSGEMSKVQFLPTVSPISISHFVEKGEHFILVLGRDQDVTIYWWEGHEFVSWLSINGAVKYFKVHVSSGLKHPTFLVFTHSSFLRVYVITSNKLEKIYETEFTSDDTSEVISVLSVKVFEENGITYMLALTKSQKKIYTILLKVHVHLLYTTISEEPSERQNDVAQQSINIVYNNVKFLKYQMDYLNKILPYVLLTHKNVIISNKVIAQVSQEVNVENGEIREILYTRMDVAGLMYHQLTHISLIRKEIESCSRKLQITQEDKNKHLVFMGNVHLKEAKMNSLNAQTVNDRTFKPESFLSLVNPQRLESVKARILKVSWLVLGKIGNSDIQDLVLDSGRVKVPVSIAGLDSENLLIDEFSTINNITASDLVNKMVILESDENSFNNISQIDAGRRLRAPVTFKLQDHTVIENLNVVLINDVPINELMSSVFVIKVKNTIYGDLHFGAGVETRQLVANKINLSVKSNAQHSPPQTIPSGSYQLVDPQYPHYIQDPQHRPPLYWRRMRRERSEDNPGTIKKAKMRVFGNLKVRRLIFQNSSLAVNNNSVPTKDFVKSFWTHSSPQVIYGPVHFNQGLTIYSNIESPVVNGKNLSLYGTRRSAFTSLMLENIRIEGDLHTRKGNSSAVWNQEKHLQGSRCKVLNIKHLYADLINEESQQNALNINHLLRGDINIITGKLKVNGDLKADLINDLDVKQKFAAAVMIDQNFQLEQVEFKNISADSMLGFTSGETTRVLIPGDIHLSQISSVTRINQHPANFSQVVNRRKGATILGKKKFSAQVLISKGIKMIKTNDINIEHLFMNLLRTSADQEITGSYTIKNSKMESVFNVTEINKVRSSKFVSTSQPQVHIRNNVNFTTIVIEGNVTSGSLHRGCRLPKVEEDVTFVYPSEWLGLHIFGDSYWQKTRVGPLQHLFDSAVSIAGDQTIPGDVLIRDLSIRNIQVQSLNDKNITFIFQDSLFKMKKNQVITGNKHFNGSFKCKNINIEGDARLQFHDVNIHETDKQLVRQTGDESITVYGHKTFLNGFKTFSLKCPEGINGIKAKSIVGRQFDEVAPPLKVKSLKVLGPLQVENIDGLNVDNFLQDCVYLRNLHSELIKGKIYVSGNVSLQGNGTVSNINNISTNNLVFERYEKRPIVTIKGCKKFLRDVKIGTDSDIDILNGKSLTETYKDSVKIHQNVTFTGSMVMLSEVELDTVYAHEYFISRNNSSSSIKHFPRDFI